jgi:ribonucleotide monophosphatase NagD (HAD superfamily)
MTSNQSSDRLDRIERVLDNLAANLAEEKERRLELRQDLDGEAERWAETIRIVESNARAIAANSDTAARQGEEMRASVTDLVSMITTQAEQAEIDRAEFRATVQQILEVLTQRFTSNGH